MGHATLTNHAIALIEYNDEDAEAKEGESTEKMGPHVKRLIVTPAHGGEDLLRTLKVNSIA